MKIIWKLFKYKIVKNSSYLFDDYLTKFKFILVN